MTLQVNLAKNDFEKLDETLKPFYKEADNGYQLDVEIPELDGLKKKRDELLGETKAEREKRKALEQRLAQIEAEKEKAAEEAAKKAGDVSSLEKSYQSKIEKLQNEALAKEKALQDQIYKLTVGQTANDIANKLAIKGSAIALLPHIQNRLTLQAKEDGSQEIRVLDLQGNISALTLDDLEQEFKANPAFAPLIAANNASGSGANGANSSAGVLRPPKALAECKTPEEKKAWLANNSD